MESRPGISVIRGRPILTSTAIASVKEWRFRPYRKKRELTTYSGALVLDGKEFETPAGEGSIDDWRRIYIVLRVPRSGGFRRLLSSVAT